MRKRNINIDKTLNKMKIGIIGFGYWGPNLVRNFVSLDDCIVKTIVDINHERLKVAKKLYPNITLSDNISSVLDDKEIDGVVIALPVVFHFEVAKRALLKDKHVLLEKPMTNSRVDALKLIELANKKKRILMVDHTFLYTGAVKKIKELIESNEIGDIQYFDSTRINLGLFQNDINVVWDLAPHDLSILEFLIKEKPYSVNAVGMSHFKNNLENIAYMTVKYNSNKIAHFNMSWSSPVKIRKIIISGTRKMIIYDDLEPTEKIKVYDSGCVVKNSEDKKKLLVDYRTGDIFIPKIEQGEALKGVAQDFINSIQTAKEPISNWRSGLSVVTLLEAAHKSIKNCGKEVLIKWD